MGRGRINRIKDVESVLPNLHTNTDSWGMVTRKNDGTKCIEVWITEMRPGARTELDSHINEQVYYIISGRGKAYVEEDQFDLEPGVSLLIPNGVMHRLDVIGTETLRFVVANGYLS